MIIYFIFYKHLKITTIWICYISDSKSALLQSAQPWCTLYALDPSSHKSTMWLGSPAPLSSPTLPDSYHTVTLPVPPAITSHTPVVVEKHDGMTFDILSKGH